MDYESNPNRALYAEFYPLWIPDPIESMRLGHKVEKQIDACRVVVDAYTTNTYETEEAAQKAQAMFPEVYERYRNKASSQLVGIPLEKAPFLSPGRVKVFSNADVYTVEQLAELSDSRLDQIGMGVREDREKAKKYLDMRKRNDPFEASQKQLAEMEARLKMLEEENAKLAASIPSTKEKKSKEAQVNL